MKPKNNKVYSFAYFLESSSLDMVYEDMLIIMPCVS